MAISCSRHLQNYPELYPELLLPVRELGSGTRSCQIHNFQELFSIFSQGIDFHLKDTELQPLVTDEVSLVDRNMLNYLGACLDQIKWSSSPKSALSGTSVLAVGDFNQTPVFGQILVKIRQKSCARRRTRSLPKF